MAKSAGWPKPKFSRKFAPNCPGFPLTSFPNPSGSRTAALAGVLLSMPTIIEAGDLLRNGASAKAPHPDASADSGAAAAAQAFNNAQDALARTAQALQSVQAMQAAARAAATGKNNLG